jgi:sugar O-acyltransferase (sialic acid O-acetyltransferase NeuD family)
LCFVVDREFAVTSITDGIPVLSTEEFGRRHPGAPVFVAIGDPQQRQQSVARLQTAGHSFPPLISSRAMLSDSVQYEDGVIVFPGATVTVNVKLRQHVHLNVNCSISHDVEIGEYTSVSPGTHVCGHVTIGRRVFIGAGACVTNGSQGSPLTIGDDAVIAAGACVICSAAAGAKIGGVPARSLSGSRE